MKSENPLHDGLKQIIREALREELEALNGRQEKPKLLLNTREAADLLQVPESWLASAAREGKIPIVRVGHYVRFSVADLEEFIEKSKGGKWNKSN
jgi:excisionase family DNA binding protein